MLPLARRIRWSGSFRMFSSGSVAFKQSDKLRKAQLLKVWNEPTYRGNSEVVRSILAEAITLHDRFLIRDVANTFEALGLQTVNDKVLAIESYESSESSDRAVNVFKSLSIEDSLAYIIDHIDTPFSSALAKSAVDVYNLALSQNGAIVENALLGNCVLRLYERISGLSAEDVEKAVRLVETIQKAGGSIQLRSYESLMASANKAKLFSVAESVYNDFKQANPTSLAVGIEVERMTTLLHRRQLKECLALYDSLISEGVSLNERMVCCVVDACISRQYFESAIKILNKWHDQGGVMTWPICRSTVRLATSIDNLVHHRSAPLTLVPTSAVDIFQDGFLPKVDVKGKNVKVDLYANAKEKIETLTSQQLDKLSRIDFDVEDDSASSTEKYDHKAEGAALTSPSGESSGAVEEGEVAATASASVESPQGVPFKSREERLEFFRQYLVRRVIGRILQTQHESAKYRHEPPVPEDLVLMCAGQLVLQGELDTLLSILHHDEEEGELSPLVKAVFVVAPIQLANQEVYWREFAALVERMRLYETELSAEVQLAALTRLMLTLFKATEMPRARHYFDRLLVLIQKDASLLPVFAELIARGELEGVARILKVLRGKGLALNEQVLIGVLKCCRTLPDISVICNAWANHPDRPVYGAKSESVSELPDNLMHVASDALCLEIARILKYAHQEEQERFVKYLRHSFSFTQEQASLLTAGRPPEVQKSNDRKGGSSQSKGKRKA